MKEIKEFSELKKKQFKERRNDGRNEEKKKEKIKKNNNLNSKDMDTKKNNFEIRNKMISTKT